MVKLYLSLASKKYLYFYLENEENIKKCIQRTIRPSLVRLGQKIYVPFTPLVITSVGEIKSLAPQKSVVAISLGGCVRFLASLTIINEFEQNLIHVKQKFIVCQHICKISIKQDEQLATLKVSTHPRRAK